MRISTSMIYDLGVDSVNKQYADLYKLQNQISTGKRVLTPSDDPVASARALEVRQSESTNEQFMKNTKYATNTLSITEGVLAQYTEVLHSARVLAINAGDPALSNEDLKSLATELEGRYKELLGLANSTDGNGQYLFSGFQGGTMPFSELAPGVVRYNGDQGQRLVQVSASRRVEVSDSGAAIFQQIKSGNGSFVSSANPENSGSGVISAGLVTDPASWNAAGNTQDYRIVFAEDTTVVPSVTTYDIVANVETVLNGVTYPAGTSLVTGAPSQAIASDTLGPRYPRNYVEGQSVGLNSLPGDANTNAWTLGIDVEIEGKPTSSPTSFAGSATPPVPGQPVPMTAEDGFEIKPSVDKDIFQTISGLIEALREGNPKGASGNARITNEIGQAIQNLGQAQDVLLTTRSALGSRMKEAEAYFSTGEDTAIQYKMSLSELEDLDYAKAISDLTLRQSGLEAAQKSFLRIQGLSLFNYING